MGEKEFKSKRNISLSFHRKWLEVINMYFFHCKMISDVVTQGEDPKNPARALTAESAYNSTQFTLFLYCKNQGQSLWSPHLFSGRTVVSARYNLQYWRSQVYCSTLKKLWWLWMYERRGADCIDSYLLCSCLQLYGIGLGNPDGAFL